MVSFKNLVYGIIIVIVLSAAGYGGYRLYQFLKVQNPFVPIRTECTGVYPAEKRLPTAALAKQACVVSALGRVNPMHQRWLEFRCNYYSNWLQKDDLALTAKVMAANC